MKNEVNGNEIFNSQMAGQNLVENTLLREMAQMQMGR